MMYIGQLLMSADWTVLALLALVSILTVVYVTSASSSRKLPPGPKPWPIVGNLPYIRGQSKPLYEVMLTLRQEYGDVVRLQLGPSLNFVFIMGKDKIYKAAVDMNDKFKFRPTNFYATNYIFKNKERTLHQYSITGIFLSNGAEHTALRKLILVTLRDFGVGRKSLEERIQEEARMLCDLIESKKGQPTYYLDNFKMGVSNIIAGIVYGNRFEYGDPTFLRLIGDIDTFFKTLSIFLPENYFPFLRFLPRSKLMAVLNVFKDLEAYAKSRIDEHRPTFDPDNLRDFVDIYLKAEQEGDKTLTAEHMYRVIVDLFNAGTDTTATAMTWAVLFLMNNPKIQQRCRKEILQSAPHFTMEDVEFEGYIIPKSSLVFFGLITLLTDKSTWHDPEVFRPERFLDDKGQLRNEKNQKEHLTPFSLGGRACLGKHLARMELILFLGTLIQRFEFSTPPGCTAPSEDRVQSGITCQPRPFEVCATPV
ncbi:CP2BB-like protein [Mya arenaria]|uniref:CP2BB-like protein n=1 Tax=Mya arenaria TaxID=6604 RepID=A0ABY7G405_MYAAR|nr:CP2BB-like protein [Mya arenaria]